MSESPDNTPFRCGIVAIIGAPNAGKSSILNRYLGQKVAIVTPKPQTTRHKILGVMTQKAGQIVFVDTPGIHLSEKPLNVGLVSRAQSALADCDVCLWVVDANRRGEDHQAAMEMVKSSQKGNNLVIALNKADLVSHSQIEDLMREITEQTSPDFVLDISAKTGRGLKGLKKHLLSLLPQGPPLYEADDLTDQSLRDIAAEYVREAVFELTRQEIPYSTAVTIDTFKEPQEQNPLYRIEATIHVERESQKKVMIGDKGRSLKQIGQKARLGLEDFLDHKVFLSLFVRVSKDWSTDSRKLYEFGYID
jgi:GTP-binding protein Era